MSDTGLRLSEELGLAPADTVLTGGMPHVVVRPHPWRRRLKTEGGERSVPLVGEALWAAQRLLRDKAGSPHLFPRYVTGDQTHANAASAALNKWLKAKTGSDATMHGFRHALRDRLRAIECPFDIVDQIGGWRTEGVGQSYGKGYSLAVLSRWMKLMAEQSA